MTTHHNPFLSPFTEAEAIPFSRIEENHYLPAIIHGITIADAERRAVASNPDEPTIENTIMALSAGDDTLERVLEVFYPMQSAMSTDSLMEIAAKAQPLLTEHAMAFRQDRELWERIKWLHDRRDSLGLEEDTARLLDDYYEAFVSGGALLEGEARDTFNANTRRMAEVSRIFGENVVKEMRDMKLTGSSADELDGIPTSVLSALEKNDDGSWALPISQPVYMEVMRTATDRSLRRRLYILYGERCTAGACSNLPLIAEAIELSRANAAILGYPTAAHSILRRRMAASPERALRLLTDLREAYRPLLAAEMKEIEAFAGHAIEPWDYAFYALRLKAEAYDFDEEKMKPYFELSNVLRGVFALASKLYGVEFSEITSEVDLYHPDVRVFRATHPDRGFLGLLYIDPFSRPEKRPGAWMTEFRGQRRMPDGTDRRPYVSIVANIAPAPEGEPVLLRPRDVETLLHETGHALHSLLSACRYAGQAGTSVKRDFVELPSQLNEAFIYRPEFLDIAARHHATGEPVPAALVEAMRRSASFGAAYQCFRQLGFGLLDLAWFTLPDAEATAAARADILAFERRATDSVRVFTDPADSHVTLSAAFTHIFSGGYTAGYYSYKWAEVLAADAYEAIAPAPDAPLDLDAARSFADNVLSRGDSADPADLYRAFRHRDADPAALLRRDLGPDAK